MTSFDAEGMVVNVTRFARPRQNAGAILGCRRPRDPSFASTRRAKVGATSCIKRALMG